MLEKLTWKVSLVGSGGVLNSGKLEAGICNVFKRCLVISKVSVCFDCGSRKNEDLAFFDTWYFGTDCVSLTEGCACAHVF